MTDNEFLQLKQKIERKKAESQKAEGVIEQIKSDWQKQYGISTLEEAEKKLSEMDQQIETKQKRLDTLQEKLLQEIPDEWKN
jgi:predicted transcriptional regulator